MHMWLLNKKHKTSSSFTNLLSNIFAYSQIVILIGRYGISTGVIKSNSVIEYSFIPYLKDNELDLNTLNSFLEKHKYLRVYLLIDSPQTQVTTERLPVVSNFGRKNVAENYIADELPKENISAYKVIGFDKEPVETWHVVVATNPFEGAVKEVINFVIGKDMKVGGIYFLSLEMMPIFEKVAKSYINEENIYTEKASIKIYAIATESLGVKIFATLYDEPIINRSVEYPYGKSKEYLQGVIENEVSEALTELKHPINDGGHRVKVIVVGDNQVANLLKAADFHTDWAQIVSIENLKRENEKLNEFADFILMRLFAKNKKFEAGNQNTRYLGNLVWTSALGFIPLDITAVLLMAYNIYLFADTKLIWNKIYETNNIYFSHVAEYRELKKNFPEIKEINAVADLLALQDIINSSSPKPYKLAKALFENLPNSFKVEKLTWELAPAKGVSFSKYVNIALDLSLTKGASKADLASWVEDIKHLDLGVVISFTELPSNDYLHSLDSNPILYRLNIKQFGGFDD